ncbi:MAG: universal stress protein [Flavobacteriales bacterium]|nr:universal stress protein [Flavobacteriales bacterium]MCB9364426.1 universal stress protein [Flavobacteriales bacterium]
MKNILFPTDFSENSNHALALALTLAKDFGAKLHILNAYKMPYSSSSPMTRTLLETLEKASEGALSNCLKTIKGNIDYKEVDIKTKAMAGSVANTVDVYANKQEVDLIVMGTKGASGLKEVLIGSNAEEVVAHSDKSVLVIPENTQLSQVKKVVFAVDFQEIKDVSVFKTYIEFIKKYKAETLFVNIYHEGNSQKSSELETNMKQIFSEINYSLNFEKNDDIVNGINKFVRENNCDMLALFSRKHGFIDKIFHKSITNKLTCQAELPMFVVKEI